jgi:hypothetical protein
MTGWPRRTNTATGMKETHRGGETARLAAWVYYRQSWRPPALRALTSLLSRISRRNEPFDFRAARLTAWHERFSRHSQPLTGRPPLDLEFGGKDSQFKRLSQTAGTGALLSPKKAPTSWANPSSVHVQRSVITAAVSHVQGPSTEGPSPLHPAIRLAIVRATYPAADISGQNEASWALFGGGARRLFSTEMNGLRDSDRLYLQGRVVFQPRLAPLVSYFAREEVRGGFPASPPSWPGAPDLERIRAEPMGAISEHLPLSQQPVVQTRLVPSLSSFAREEVRSVFPVSPLSPIGATDIEQTSSEPVVSPSLPGWMEIGATPSSAQPHQAGTAEPPGPIERLIERMALPAVLPGLEFRPVHPEVLAAQTERSKTDAVENGPAKVVEEPNPVSVGPSAPPLDINAVADKVYQTLLQRQLLERERKGVY